MYVREIKILLTAHITPYEYQSTQRSHLPQSLSILPCSNRRETPTPPTAGNQMKTITLRIPSVEAAMLQELQKTHKQFRNLEALVLGLIREEYGKNGGKQTQ